MFKVQWNKLYVVSNTTYLNYWDTKSAYPDLPNMYTIYEDGVCI